MDKHEIADTLNRLYDRQAWDYALQIATGLVELVKHNWRGLSVTASLTAAAIMAGCNVYFGQDQGTETPPAETQGGGVTVVSPIATATITAEAATSTPPPPEIKPIPLGIEVANAGGADSGIIITNPNILLPTNIDPAFLADHRVAFKTMQERIGYGFCTVINDNQQGPCYDVVGSIPGDIPHNGQNFVHDSAASNPESGLYVYTAANGEKLLNVGIFKHQDGFTLIQAIDKNGNVQTHLVGPDGKVQKLFDLIPLGVGGSIVNIDLENGTLTLSTSEVVSLVTGELQTPVILTHPQTWAECQQICPEIDPLNDVSRIQFNLVPLDTNPENFSYVISNDEYVRAIEYPHNNFSNLGITRMTWNGIPGVVFSREAINDYNASPGIKVIHSVFFIDGSPGHTQADADKLIREFNDGEAGYKSVIEFHNPTASDAAWAKAAVDFIKAQGIGGYPALNDFTPYEEKILIVVD